MSKKRQGKSSRKVPSQAKLNSASRNKKYRPSKIVIALTLVVLTVLTAAIVLAIPRSYEEGFDDNIVAMVNGNPITVAEFVRAMHNNRSSVVSQFVVQGRSQSELDFWTTPTNDITPLEALKDAAFEDIIETYTILGLGQERGFVRDISHQAMLDNMTRENMLREQALAAGQIVYGPQSFTEDVFLDLFMSDIRAALRMEWEQNADFSPEEIMDVFDRYWAGEINNPGTSIIDKIHVPFGFMPPIFARAAIDGIYGRLQAGEDFNGPWDDIWEGAEIIEQHINMMRAMQHQDQAPSFQALLGLRIGEISEVYRDGEGYSILRVIEVYDVAYHTLSGSAWSISNAMAGEEFDAYLRQRKEAARVRMNYDLLARIDQNGRILEEAEEGGGI